MDSAAVMLELKIPKKMNSNEKKFSGAKAPEKIRPDQHVRSRDGDTRENFRALPRRKISFFVPKKMVKNARMPRSTTVPRAWLPACPGRADRLPSRPFIYIKKSRRARAVPCRAKCQVPKCQVPRARVRLWNNGPACLCRRA